MLYFFPKAIGTGQCHRIILFQDSSNGRRLCSPLGGVSNTIEPHMIRPQHVSLWFFKYTFGLRCVDHRLVVAFVGDFIVLLVTLDN